MKPFVMLQFQHWIIIASFCKQTNFAVQGLTEGQEYLFRILAANANGTGLPLDGVNPIKAKAPFDLPDAPGAPVVTEVGGDFVNLSWNKPEEDGGSRIKVECVYTIFVRTFSNCLFVCLCTNVAFVAVMIGIHQ